MRLRFYDLSDERLAWDYLSVGQSVKSKDHDMTDVVEHGSNESFLGGLVTSVVNSAIKGDPKYPAAPDLEASLVNAFEMSGSISSRSKK